MVRGSPSLMCRVARTTIDCFTDCDARRGRQERKQGQKDISQG